MAPPMTPSSSSHFCHLPSSPVGAGPSGLSSSSSSGFSPSGFSSSDGPSPSSSSSSGFSSSGFSPSGLPPSGGPSPSSSSSTSSSSGFSPSGFSPSGFSPSGGPSPSSSSSSSAPAHDPRSLFQLNEPSAFFMHLVFDGPIGSEPSAHVRLHMSLLHSINPPATSSSSSHLVHLPSSPEIAGLSSSPSSSSSGFSPSGLPPSGGPSPSSSSSSTSSSSTSSSSTSSSSTSSSSPSSPSSVTSTGTTSASASQSKTSPTTPSIPYSQHCPEQLSFLIELHVVINSRRPLHASHSYAKCSKKISLLSAPPGLICASPAMYSSIAASRAATDRLLLPVVSKPNLALK